MISNHDLPDVFDFQVPSDTYQIVVRVFSYTEHLLEFECTGSNIERIKVKVFSKKTDRATVNEYLLKLGFVQTGYVGWGTYVKPLPFENPV